MESSIGGRPALPVTGPILNPLHVCGIHFWRMGFLKHGSWNLGLSWYEEHCYGADDMSCICMNEWLYPICALTPPFWALNLVAHSQASIMSLYSKGSRLWYFRARGEGRSCQLILWSFQTVMFWRFWEAHLPGTYAIVARYEGSLRGFIAPAAGSLEISR